MLFFVSLLLFFSNAHSEIKGKTEIVNEEYGYSIDVYNDEPFTIYLRLSAKLKGLEPSVKLPAVFPIPKGISKGLLKFTKIESARKYSIQTKVRFSYAPYSTKKPDDYLYYFPFEHGKSYRIGQGWNGSFSHQDKSYYAIDFDMVEGTKITAVRDGVVVDVKEDSKIGGPSKSYAEDGNHILIRHSDNTLASYGHLKYQGVLVDKGDKVKEGQVIGLSGNTGYSTGPHLHFQIDNITTDWKYTSIPFKFRGKDGIAILPKEGHTYYAYLPGGEEFEEVRGTNVKISDFDDYSKPVAKNAKTGIRAKTYDDRLVVFISNGIDREIDAKVKFKLKNLKSVLGNPVSIKLNPLEERFLTVLLIKKLKKTYSYTADISYAYKKSDEGEEEGNVSGKNIEISDFDNYSKPVAKNSKVNIRTETYDDGFVVFVRNGTDRKINAKAKFKLKNLKSVLGNPVSIKLNPLEERFVTVLLIKNPKKSSSVSTSLKYSFE